MTRYEFDSQTTRDLSMLKGGYYEGSDELWDVRTNLDERRYIDANIARRGFNSYDSLDKYVFVIDFEASIDNKNMFDLGWRNGVIASQYNILGDAGYIPHFAYQSLVRYEDADGGTAYTWSNAHLKDKTHMQFELLGMDDKEIPKTYEQMSRMVVDDITDNCKTILCPARFMDDIYRIWCENTTVPARYGDYPYDMYFANEYKDYPNPIMDFEDGKFVEWTPPESEMFELELPREMFTGDSESEDEQENMDEFKSLLDEYYVSVMRTDDA